MLKKFRDLIKREKKRRKELRVVRRRQELLRVGQHLLAKADCDEVSVARIAADANCSVGAFYGRFRDKDTYLSEVIVATFDAASSTCEREFESDHWRNAPRAKIVRHLIRHMVNTMTAETAGVARTALKRAHTDPSALEPLLSYRSTVTERAVVLLGHRVHGSLNAKRTIRTAMQMAHATVSDAMLHNRGPLRMGGHPMIDELSEMILHRLKIPAV